MKLQLKRKQVHDIILEVCIKIARRNEGALIIVGTCKHDPMVKQEVSSFNIINNPKLLESLALIDGAVIVDKFGLLTAYGTKVYSNRVFKNFGTRHSAGISASMNEDTTVYLVSEEERKVKVFKDGKLIMQIDPFEKNIIKQIPEIIHILSSVGAGTLGVFGASVIVPSLGITLIPGVIIFGGSYYLINKINEWTRGR